MLAFIDILVSGYHVTQHRRNLNHLLISLTAVKHEIRIWAREFFMVLQFRFRRVYLNFYTKKRWLVTGTIQFSNL